MANSVKEVLTVEKLTQYGVKANGQNYSYSKFCSKDTVIAAGDVIEAEVYTGQKGGKYLNAYVVTGQADVKPVAKTPSLPPTTVTETPAPKGEVPVAPAQRKAAKVESETMSKADWANKDIAIERVAIVKSVLESPAYAQLSVGKRVEDVLATGEAMVDFFLNKLNSLK